MIPADRFAALYRDHYAEIVAFCWRRVGERDRAEDLAQQAFLAAWENQHAYDERGTFRAWIYRVARNKLIDELRTSRSTESLDAALHVADPSRSPEELAATALDVEGLLRAVASLPEEQRTAFELRSAGLAHAEIAQVLARSEDAAKQLWHRATLQLRRELALTGGRHVG
jgi:RNA polymerase sigma-70 factor (ECF subfamily)